MDGTLKTKLQRSIKHREKKEEEEEIGEPEPRAESSLIITWPSARYRSLSVSTSRYNFSSISPPTLDDPSMNNPRRRVVFPIAAHRSNLPTRFFFPLPPREKRQQIADRQNSASKSKRAATGIS